MLYVQVDIFNIHQIVKVWDVFTGRSVFEFKTEESNGRSGQAAVDGISAIEIDKSGKRFASMILHKRITTLSIMTQYSRKFLPRENFRHFC